MIAGLEHYWSLDEATGASVTDSVGGWVSPVIGDPGDATISAGWIEGGRDLGAVSPFAAIELWDDDPDEDYVFDRWTFGAAFKLPEAYAGGLDLYYSESETTWLWVYLGAGGTSMRAMVGDGGLNYEAVWELPEGSLLDDAFHLVHVTGNESEIRLMVDGVQRAVVEHGLPFRPKSGGDTAPTLGWDFGGVVDEVQIWSRAIAESEHFAMWDGEVAAVDYAESIVRAVPEGIDDLVLLPRYFCDIEDGVLPPLRVPIRSWQATIQRDRASYVQVVIPSIGRWLEQIQQYDHPEFVIRRGNVLPDGSMLDEFELARAPMSLQADQGWLNHTGMMTGYAAPDPPVSQLVRTLRSVRSLSTSGDTVRARAALDFVVRPGDTVIADGVAFEVAYINFYVTDFDEYMDLGSRDL